MSSRLIVNSIRHTGASGDAVSLANDGTCTANITNNLSNRNKIINGSMICSQRGSSLAYTGSTNAYLIDRFKFVNTHDGASTLSQSTTSPDGFSNSLKIDVTTADTSVGASQFSQVSQRIEGQDLQDLAYGTSGAKTITVSFYVRSNKTGNYAFVIQQADNSYKQVSQTYTINSADTWERKTFSFAGDTSGVINNDNGSGLELYWWLLAGTTYTSGSSRSTWTTYANGDAGAGHAVNLFDSTSNEWYITGVQLEVNSSGVATDFEHRSFGNELIKCQRYFQSITAGFITGARGASSSMLLYSITVPVNLRSSPTVAANADLGHSSYSVRSYRDGSGTSDSTSTPSANSTYFRSEGNVVHLQQDGFSVTDDRSATIFLSGGAITMDSEL